MALEVLGPVVGHVQPHHIHPIIVAHQGFGPHRSHVRLLRQIEEGQHHILAVGMLLRGNRQHLHEAEQQVHIDAPAHILPPQMLLQVEKVGEAGAPVRVALRGELPGQPAGPAHRRRIAGIDPHEHRLQIRTRLPVDDQPHLRDHRPGFVFRRVVGKAHDNPDRQSLLRLQLSLQVERVLPAVEEVEVDPGRPEAQGADIHLAVRPEHQGGVPHIGLYQGAESFQRGGPHRLADPRGQDREPGVSGLGVQAHPVEGGHRQRQRGKAAAQLLRDDQLGGPSLVGLRGHHVLLENSEALPELEEFAPLDIPHVLGGPGLAPRKDIEPPEQVVPQGTVIVPVGTPRDDIRVVPILERVVLVVPARLKEEVLPRHHPRHLDLRLFLSPGPGRNRHQKEEDHRQRSVRQARHPSKGSRPIIRRMKSRDRSISREVRFSSLGFWRCS